MEKHKYCPDENSRCQHGEDLNCPALEDKDQSDADRYRTLCAHWDKFTGSVVRLRPVKEWLDEELDKIRADQ